MTWHDRTGGYIALALANSELGDIEFPGPHAKRFVIGVGLAAGAGRAGVAAGRQPKFAAHGGRKRLRS